MSHVLHIPNTRSVDATRASVAPLAQATMSAAAAEEDHRATLISQSRLHRALATLRAEGLDEIIISTLPSGISPWLGMDLPGRAQRKFQLAVTTVTAGA